MSHLDPDEHFYTADEVARMLRVAESTLANQRNQGTGLPWCKVGGRVLYKRSDIADAIAGGSRGVGPETVARAAKRVFGGSISEAQLAALWPAICEEAVRG